MTDFDISAADALDEAQLAIKHPRTEEPTGWVWTFFGPGHPKTIDVANRASRHMLKVAAEKEQARVNGKKWKAEDETVDELRAKNVDNIVARTKDFTPVKMDGQTIEFTPEAAKKLLLDRKKGWLFSQVIEFLAADESFIPPSATS